jgi:hypothetical protein
MGWSREQTAGIIANLKQESSTFSPSEVGDGGLAYGIAQWHPDRQAMFRRVMGKPIRGSTLLEQAKFLQWELTHSEANAGRQLKGQTTARGAGAAFSKYYERPANQLGEMNQRGGSAERLMPQITPLGSSVGAANIGGGAGGGDGGVNVSNNTTIHVAAGPDARATASAVADQQVRVHERQVRATAGKLV